MNNNFCKNCGTPLQQGYNVCPNCGTPVSAPLVNNQPVGTQMNGIPYQQPVYVQSEKVKYNGYFVSTSVIMIILAVILFAGASGNARLGYDLNLVFRIPALFALAGGILCLCGRKNKVLLIVSGCVYFVGATFNIIGISDVSLFTIASIIFGVLNIVFALKK